jgi:tetratricopeptide (TPR) repeat protein
MAIDDILSQALASLGGGVLVVEAERGRARAEALREWAARPGAEGRDSLFLRCDFRDGGVWAGIAQWVGELLPRIERESPALAEKHATELSVVLPDRPLAYPGAKTLTEVAEGREAVRNYAMDRAYRIPHGVIDLLDAWYTENPPAPRVVVCEGYDRAGALCRRFFRELLRRRGERMGLTLVLAVSPGAAEAVRSEFAPGTPLSSVRLDLPADPPGLPPEVAVLGRLARHALSRGEFPDERHFPALLRYWEEGDDPAAVLPWMAYALGRYNHYGFYEDALLFLEPVAAGLHLIPETREFLTRWNLVGAIYNSLAAVGQVERAYRVVQEEALERITDPLDRARACYVAAMVNARFLPRKDFETAKRYLEQGFSELERVDPADEYREFLSVFLSNGLAFIHSRQGRPREAIELCARGYEQMSARLGDHRHRLHRSVLLYNIAQVYSATREHEKAVEYFGAAMEMDPNYSEYHNERGNVFLAMGRYEDAIRDYHEAIRLSAPYQEVWTNLGQCYRRMGRLQDAADAYSRALDLDPAVEIARVGRAQVLAALGRTEAARADYEAALAANPEQPLVLANLAGLLYRAGDLEGALARLDAAVALAPDNAMLLLNRAVALEGLGRADEAARGLRAWLALHPQAADRAAVEEKIAALGGVLASV